MHISEGVLSGPVLATGAIFALAGTGLGLKKIDYDRIVHVAILASAFFCGIIDSCQYRACKCPSDFKRDCGIAAWICSNPCNPDGIAASGGLVPIWRPHHIRG